MVSGRTCALKGTTNDLEQLCRVLQLCGRLS